MRGKKEEEIICLCEVDGIERTFYFLGTVTCSYIAAPFVTTRWEISFSWDERTDR